MMERLNKLESDLRERDARLDQANRTVEQLLSRPAAANPPAVRPEDQDPGTMPDAVLEPEKFRQWLPRKLAYERSVTTEMVKREKNEATTTVQLDNMWSEFQRDFPDAAKDEELAAAAFSIELRKNNMQIPSDRRKFMKGIADRLGGARRSDDNPAENRTGGLSSGSSAGAGPAVKPRSKASDDKDEAKVVPFADQIANIQAKMGLL
jgi:hypothetical protein